MKRFTEFIKKLLNTMVKGVGAFSLFAFLPLLGVMCAVAVCLHYCSAVIATFLASLADDGNLSRFIYPRWSNRSKWIPQLNFD